MNILKDIFYGIMLLIVMAAVKFGVIPDMVEGE
jgi:hypothetical protein